MEEIQTQNEVPEEAKEPVGASPLDSLGSKNVKSSEETQDKGHPLEQSSELEMNYPFDEESKELDRVIIVKNDPNSLSESLPEGSNLEMMEDDNANSMENASEALMNLVCLLPKRKKPQKPIERERSPAEQKEKVEKPSSGIRLSMTLGMGSKKPKDIEKSAIYLEIEREKRVEMDIGKFFGFYMKNTSFMALSTPSIDIISRTSHLRESYLNIYHWNNKGSMMMSFLNSTIINLRKYCNISFDPTINLQKVLLSALGNLEQMLRLNSDSLTYHKAYLHEISSFDNESDPQNQLLVEETKDIYRKMVDFRDKIIILNQKLGQISSAFNNESGMFNKRFRDLGRELSELQTNQEKYLDNISTAFTQTSDSLMSVTKSFTSSLVAESFNYFQATKLIWELKRNQAKMVIDYYFFLSKVHEQITIFQKEFMDCMTNGFIDVFHFTRINQVVSHETPSSNPPNNPQLDRFLHSGQVSYIQRYCGSKNTPSNLELFSKFVMSYSQKMLTNQMCFVMAWIQAVKHERKKLCYLSIDVQCIFMEIMEDSTFVKTEEDKKGQVDKAQTVLFGNVGGFKFHFDKNEKILTVTKVKKGLFSIGNNKLTYFIENPSEGERFFKIVSHFGVHVQ